jgi:hypothetical protein
MIDKSHINLTFLDLAVWVAEGKDALAVQNAGGTHVRTVPIAYGAPDGPTER